MGLWDIFQKAAAETAQKEAEKREWKRKDALLEAFYNDKKARRVQKA